MKVLSDERSFPVVNWWKTGFHGHQNVPKLQWLLKLLGLTSLYYPPEVRRTKYCRVRVFQKNTSLSASLESRSD